MRGRGLAADLREVAAARGLKRTLMRGLALSVVLERRAGEAKAAAGHLEAYLRAYGDAPYAGAAAARARGPARRCWRNCLNRPPHWADEEDCALAPGGDGAGGTLRGSWC